MKNKFRTLLIIILVATFLRLWAANLLPQDYDEPTYLQNGFDYAAFLRAGNLNGVIDYSQNSEHPAFVKLLYAGGVLLLGKNDTWINGLYFGRAISAVFGVLAVAFMTVLDPLAGAMLAVHTLAVKYTSEVYLEAVPAAMMLAAILAFLKLARDGPKRWLWLSALALGVVAASKYSYLPVTLIVLGYLAFLEKKIPWSWLLVYAAVALGTFFLLDVHLWHDPVHRLVDSLAFHVTYSQGEHVQAIGYPWYQPFIWVFTSAPAGWHPDVFFYLGFDGPIALLAVAGVPREWKARRWLVVWLASGIVFLLAWPTKWPQYALTVTPALCIMGAETLHRIWQWLRAKETYWDYFRNLLPAPNKWFWLALAAFALFIAGVYLSAAIKLAAGKVGWSHLTAENSFLPDDTVHALLPLEDNRMLIATDKGAVVYAPPVTTDQIGTWNVYDTADSGLANDEVLVLLRDSAGAYWLGTQAGVSRTTDFKSWTSYTGTALGLPADRVVSLAASADGHVYAGTLRGAAVWDGTTWTPLPQVEGQPVFALTAAGGAVWFGTGSGADRLDPATGSWTTYPMPNAVKHVLVDASGTVWAATAGNGLAKLGPGGWTYFTSANSGLPLNLVNWVEQPAPGQLWVATSLGSQVGGLLASFDGSRWNVYDSNNSGFTGSEPLVIATSGSGQVWIGTASSGVDLYTLRR